MVSEINFLLVGNSRLHWAKYSKNQSTFFHTKQEQKVPQKAVIGIGAGKNYTLYDVGTDNTQFVQAGYKSEKRIKGFGRL